MATGEPARAPPTWKYLHAIGFARPILAPSWARLDKQRATCRPGAKRERRRSSSRLASGRRSAADSRTAAVRRATAELKLEGARRVANMRVGRSLGRSAASNFRVGAPVAHQRARGNSSRPTRGGGESSWELQMSSRVGASCRIVSAERAAECQQFLRAAECWGRAACCR